MSKNVTSHVGAILVIFIAAPAALARVPLASYSQSRLMPSNITSSHAPSSHLLLLAQADTDESEPTTPVGYLIRGRQYREQDLYQEAIDDFEQAIAQAPSDEFEAIARYNLATTHQERGRIVQAIEQYQQAIALDSTLIIAYTNLLQILETRADPAFDRYQTQLDEVIQSLVDDVDNTSGFGAEINLIQQGSSLSDRGQHEDAIQLFDAAIALNPNLVAAYNNKAKALVALGQTDEAVETYQRAIDVVRFERACLNPSEADALSTAYTNLAELLLQSDQLSEARLAYDQAIISDRDLINCDPLDASVLANELSAEDYYNLARLLGKQASSFERRAEELRDNTNVTTAERASILAEQRWRRAVSSYEQVISLDDSFAPAYNDLGVYWLKHGDVERGIDLLSQAVEIGPSPRRLENLAIAWIDLATTARRNGEVDLAQEYTHNAVNAYLQFEQIIDRIEQIPSEIQSSSLLDALIVKQDFSSYEESLISSATNQAYYSWYINRLMWLHRSPDEPQGLTAGMTFDVPLDVQAFQVAERARARGLLESITKTNGCQPSDSEALCSLRRQFSALAQRWEELESASLSIDTLQAVPSTSDEKSESAEITEQLIRLTEEFEELQSQGSDAQQRVESELTLEEIQSNLDDDTILLEYWLGDAWQSNSQSYLWAISKPGVISPSGFLSFRIDADRQSINEMARTYYDYLTHPSQRFKPVSVARAGMKLSQTLLGPIADQLEDQRLVVVADGMLRYIPFNALPDPNADQRFMNRPVGDVDLDDLPDPLIRNHEIVHLPSFSTLLRIRERAEERDVGSQTLAIITDPKLENTGLEAERILDIARKEDRDLETTSVSFDASQVAFSDTGSRVYFSDQDLAEYRLIHFATHGRVFDTNLAESGLTASLVDAQGELSTEPNLFLSIPDVFRFNLPADLVVLSACRTGLGEEVTGEGMVGFSQGFLAAGASGIVVSLWSVNDEATRVLMEEFYDELFDSLDTSRNTPQSASALRHAQLRLWDERRWNLPYYWAGFTFQGEWR